MTENKRFTMDEEGNITDTVEDRTLYVENRYTACKYFTNLLNELYEENNEIKQLIHTMLVQIDADKINTENTRYSARIVFTFEEFKKIQQIWKGDMND